MRRKHRSLRVEIEAASMTQFVAVNVKTNAIKIFERRDKTC
jgi:hypothetical protein